MKAFWWYKENQIAGMARPGFNFCQWFDLPFDEAMLMGWLGQHSSGAHSLATFQSHLNHYIPTTRRFYQLDDAIVEQTLANYRDEKSLLKIINRLIERTRFFKSASVVDGHLHFELSREQLDLEVEFLKSKNIDRIISLTESHHLSNVLDDEFQLHHIAIPDMGAPSIEQARVLSEILEISESKGERLAVHCLAGIGRTSTMLIAAEILRGKRLEDLLVSVQAQNPSFKFVGSQAEFLKKLAK